MATITVSGSSVVGSQRNTWGTFAASTEANFEIDTAMKYVNSIILNSDTADASGVKVELNTSSNGTVKLTPASSSQWQDGTWSAIGYGGG
tara:strand:- start:587 stop:856 length:270 start_codon:yes stop_codon:yes gene_type:complete